MAKAAKTPATKKAAAKRTEIAPNDDKRYIRRDEKGRIKESDDEGKSLSKDVRQHSKNVVKSGQGDKGDQARKKSATKKSATNK